MKLLDAIINNKQESRREWILDLFEKHGKANSINHRFQVWEHENHPFLLDSVMVYNQRLNYLHYNPVVAGFVAEPYYWLFSSANTYLNGITGLLQLEMLD